MIENYCVSVTNQCYKRIVHFHFGNLDMYAFSEKALLGFCFENLFAAVTFHFDQQILYVA